MLTASDAILARNAFSGLNRMSAIMRWLSIVINCKV